MPAATGEDPGHPLIIGDPFSLSDYHRFTDDDFTDTALFDASNSPDGAQDTASIAENKSHIDPRELAAMRAPDSPTESLFDTASNSTSSDQHCSSAASKEAIETLADVSMDGDSHGDIQWDQPPQTHFENGFHAFGLASPDEGFIDYGNHNDAIQQASFEIDTAASSSPDMPGKDMHGPPSLVPLPKSKGPNMMTFSNTEKKAEPRAIGHVKRNSQHSIPSPRAGRKREASGEPSPMSMGTSSGFSPTSNSHVLGFPSPPNLATDVPMLNGLPPFTANQAMQSAFGFCSFPPHVDFHHRFQLDPQIPQQAPPFNAHPMGPFSGVCGLWIDTLPVKSRVETQIPIRIIISPMPPGIAKLHLPTHTISKPKLMARPPATHSPDTLELFVSLVCTSAMDNPALKHKALERAKVTPQGHLPDPDDEENSPQNGGEVRICTGCITRERKRAARKKIKKPEEDMLWSQDEERRVVVFNTHEIKEWQPFTGLQNPNGRPEPPRSGATMQLDAPMRIACYCRHHNEKLGFNVIFTIKNWQGVVIAQDMSQRIMITDDHKTNPITQFSTTTHSAMNEVFPEMAAPRHHPMALETGNAPPMPPPAVNGGFGGFSPSSSMQMNLNMQPSSYGTATSAKTTPTATSAVPCRPMSRDPSPSRMGPLAKKRKSSAPNVPKTLTMTRMDSPPHQAPKPPAGAQPASAPSPFPAHSTSSPNPNLNQTPNSASFAQADALFGQLLSQGQFALGPSGLSGTHEMPFFGGRRSGSMDNMAMAQLFSSAPASNHASRAPSPSGLRTSQLMQPLNGSMGAMPMNLDRPRPPPIIHKVIPNEGPTMGGIEVTVLGASFYQGIEVWFGDIKATTTTFWGESSLVCLLPPSPAAGAVPVTIGTQSVATPHMQLKSPPFFRYLEESEDQLIRSALSVLGSKMSGQLLNVNDLARRILSAGGSGWTGGASGNSPTNGPLMNQGSQGHLEAQLLNVLELLRLEESAHPLHLDIPSPTGHTMLHFACALGQHRLVAALLDMGANMDARDRGGFTPLHIAAIRNQAPIVERLMGAGADVTIKSLSGLRPRDVAASRAVERAIRHPHRHVRTQSGGLPQSRAARIAPRVLSWEPRSSSHMRPERRSVDSDEESLEYTSGDLEDEDPDDNRYLTMRRRSQASLSSGKTAELEEQDSFKEEGDEEDDDDDDEEEGAEEDEDEAEQGDAGEINGGRASNPTAMAAAVKDQIQAQLHQLQQTMGIYLQNLATLSQAGMPQMPTFSGDYQAYLPQAQFMRKVQQLVPGIAGNRTDAAGGGDHHDEPDSRKLVDDSVDPPAYHDLFPRRNMDTKTESAVRAAAEAEADMKCASLYDEASTSAVAPASSSTKGIPAVLEIGRKNAITREQQENLLRAREQNLKRLSKDRNLFFLWIPLLLAMICALLYSYFPSLFHFLWSSLRAVAQSSNMGVGRAMENTAAPIRVMEV